jgi:amino acid adenylation domain-containing protein
MQNTYTHHPDLLKFSVGHRVQALPNLPHRNFEHHARHTPDATAIFFAGEQISFRSLDTRANKLAHLLISFGIQRNTTVAVFLTRSPELVTAILAIHKANAACALLDPNLPPVRLKGLLSELNPSVVIASKQHAEYFSDHGIRLIDSDCMDDNIAAYSEQGLLCDPLPDDTAYIFFTSGTSGKPKAVMSPYGWHAEPGNIPPLSERHILKTDSGTTFTRAEVLRPLVNGQPLFIAPIGLEKNLHGLITYIQEHSITHLISTPTALKVMLEIDDFRNCHSLVSVLCSGEMISEKLRQDFSAISDADLIISYGCTEAPGAAKFTYDPRLNCALLTVGKTAPLMEIYVLDENLFPLPLGVEGEVYLGGLIAKGYMNDPELTAQKFIPNPFSPGSYLFRTGDRGQWLTFGYLKILGRMDSQIKIRGYRVELGDIEKALLQDPEISQAVVTTNIQPNGHTAVIAYILPISASLSSAVIRIALRQSLPDYMIPDQFIIAPQMPLTANGKIDRAALAKGFKVQTNSVNKMKPQDAIEKNLVAIWENLLHVSPVGVNENFFNLGGHSLLAAQMLTQVEKIFQKKLPLDLLWFNEGTILSLAKFLRNQFQAGFNPECITLKQGSSKPLFVTHVRGGHLHDYYQLARCLTPSQTVIGLQARGVFGVSKPDMRIEKIAAHCIEAMQSVQPKGPYLLAGFSSGGIIAYEIAQQLRVNGEEVGLLVLLDSYCPNNNLSGRLSKAIRQLFKGKTRAIRDLIYSLFIKGLLLDKACILNDAKKAHRWAHLHYQPKNTPQNTVLLFAEDSLNTTGKKMLGWDQYLIGKIKQHHFPCNHYNLVRYPMVQDAAKKLQEYLDQANVKDLSTNAQR